MEITDESHNHRQGADASEERGVLGGLAHISEMTIVTWSLGRIGTHAKSVGFGEWVVVLLKDVNTGKLRFRAV